VGKNRNGNATAGETDGETDGATDGETDGATEGETEGERDRDSATGGDDSENERAAGTCSRRRGAVRPFPELLDRRYDLDIAPSMINMDLRFNGAYMVVNSIYNILACKFGYQHMLSVQMLYWMSIQKYYQINSIDTAANYKLSLCTLLDIAKTVALCSERELSIYTNVAAVAPAAATTTTTTGTSAHQHASRGDPHTSATATATATATTTTTTHPPGVFPASFLAHKCSTASKPFYRMQHYYVPNDAAVIKRALYSDHLILANLTLFSNLLSSRGGVVPFPNSTDQSAGMIVVTILGYQANVWIVRFPFGLHWGDQGIGYVSFEYFSRYNRDRWLIEIDECGEPPEYMSQRKTEQASENSELLAAHMDPTTYHHQQQQPLSTEERPTTRASSSSASSNNSDRKHATQSRMRRRFG
jgi:hypothetical protein